jgi:hypothetical protein
MGISENFYAANGKGSHLRKKNGPLLSSADQGGVLRILRFWKVLLLLRAGLLVECF